MRMEPKMSDGKYTQIFLAVVGVIVFLGFVLPMMISDPSDISVIGGIGITLGLGYMGGLWVKHLIENNKKKGP